MQLQQCCCKVASSRSAAECQGADDSDVISSSSTRRALVRAVALGVSSSAFGLQAALDAVAGGLPPEEKPKLCDAACEKELENVPMVTRESGLQYKDIKVGEGPSPPVGFQVAANCVAMVPPGQIFDSSLEKGQPYIFRVGSGQVIKGLDEGILTMKVGRTTSAVHTWSISISERPYISSWKAKSGSKQSRRIRRQPVVHTRS